MDPKEELEKRAIARLDGEDPSNRDLADGVKVIIGRLWTKEDLREFVQHEQAAFCANCTRVKGARVSLRERWAMGIITTLVGTLCAALGYYIKSGVAQ
ncbi:MAG: hypothetical protein IJ173_02110 [Kiritimatiellae bacterium]|nr:hypothetical protein [Kiritimatiellia bacterium]